MTRSSGGADTPTDPSVLSKVCRVAIVRLKPDGIHTALGGDGGDTETRESAAAAAAAVAAAWEEIVSQGRRGKRFNIERAARAAQAALMKQAEPDPDLLALPSVEKEEYFMAAEVLLERYLHAQPEATALRVKRRHRRVHQTMTDVGLVRQVHAAADASEEVVVAEV